MAEAPSWPAALGWTRACAPPRNVPPRIAIAANPRTNPALRILSFMLPLSPTLCRDRRSAFVRRSHLSYASMVDGLGHTGPPGWPTGCVPGSPTEVRVSPTSDGADRRHEQGASHLPGDRPA